MPDTRASEHPSSAAATQPSRLWLIAYAALVLALQYARRSSAKGSPARPGPPGRDARPQATSGQEVRDQAGTREDGRGREAATPSQIPGRGWKDILWRAYEEMNRDRILLVAAGVTFYGLLALFPAITAFMSLYGLFFDPQSVQSHIQSLSGVLPDGAIEIIREQVTRIAEQGGTRLGFAFAIGLAISLWSANAGMKAIFDGLNIAYGEEEKRSFIKLNAVSLLFTIGAIIFVLVALAAVAIIPIVLRYLGLDQITEWLISILRWPLLLAILVVALAVLYRYGPSRDEAQWRWLTPGSVVASVGWLIFSMLFSWYVANFGGYNATYGSLGAAIGFMIWMWLATTIILLGAELNAEIEHQTAKDTTEGAAEPMGRRGARMADTLGAAKA